MPFKDFIVLDSVSEDNAGHLVRRVCAAGSSGTDCASLIFNRDGSGGSISLLPSNTVWSIWSMKGPSSWGLALMSGDTVATATKIRKKTFVFREKELDVVMLPGDQPESFICSTYSELSAGESTSNAEGLSRNTDILYARICIESKSAVAHRLSYDPAQGCRIALFCLWVADFHRTSSKGHVHCGTCLPGSIHRL